MTISIENWNKNDLVYFWESKSIYNNYFKQLSCSWFNNIFYNKGLEFDKRNKTCYLIKKGKLIHKKIIFFHKKNSIKIDNLSSLNEISNIFNECKYFYCYRCRQLQPNGGLSKESGCLAFEKSFEV